MIVARHVSIAVSRVCDKSKAPGSRFEIAVALVRGAVSTSQQVAALKRPPVRTGSWRVVTTKEVRATGLP